MKPKGMTIVGRLWLLAAVAVISLFVVGATAIVLTNRLSAQLRTVSDHALPGVKSLLEARNASTAMRALLLTHLATVDEQQRKQIEQQLAATNQQLLDGLARYAKLADEAEDRAQLAASQKTVQAYEAAFAEVMQSLTGNARFVARQQIEAQALPLAAQLEQGLSRHAETTLARAERLRGTSRNIIALGHALSWSTVLAGTLIVAALSLMLIRKIAGDLGEVSRAMAHIEREQDFTTRVDVHSRDELGDTARAINRLLDKLQHNLRTLTEGISQVATSASALREISTRVEGSAGEQSEAAASIAASVEQLTVSIHHVGMRAQDADQLSVRSGEMAQAGCQVIAQTVRDINDISAAVASSAARIRELEQHSELIAGVVRVISEVAEQTNMLALNAAIEAARAGEHGRGFAVVADEVRKLAERTTGSTHEIARTIEVMRHAAREAVGSMQVAVGRVEEGVARAQDASAAIQRIGAGSRETVDMVSEISLAIREQSQASEGIATQVEQVARTAESGNAAASAGAEAARALDQLAARMRHVVVAYRL